MQRMNNEAQIPWDKWRGDPEKIREWQRDTWTQRYSSSQSLNNILKFWIFPSNLEHSFLRCLWDCLLYSYSIHIYWMPTMCKHGSQHLWHIGRRKNLKTQLPLLRMYSSRGRWMIVGIMNRWIIQYIRKWYDLCWLWTNKKVEQGRVLGGHLGCNFKEGS